MAFGDYGRDALIDPAPGGLGEYVFVNSHEEEDEFGVTTSIDRTANTAGTGTVIQAGAPTPEPLRITGKIFTYAQRQKLIDFTQKSEVNTLIYRNFYGEEFEVLITGYKDKPNRTLFNGRDAGMRKHYYTYSMEMTVVNVRSGAWG